MITELLIVIKHNFTDKAYNIKGVLLGVLEKTGSFGCMLKFNGRVIWYSVYSANHSLDCKFQSTSRQLFNNIVYIQISCQVISSFSVNFLACSLFFFFSRC